MTETKHSEFSPSGFARRFHCPASYILEAGKDDDQSPIADEGTRIHAEVASVILGERKPFDTDPLTQRCVTRFEGVVEAMDCPNVYVEKTLESRVEGIVNFGTIDVLLICGADAVIIDWKTGYNRVDFPDRNWQVKWYVLFTFDNFPSVEGVKATVYNPRIWQDDSAYFKREDAETIREELARVISVCKSGSPAPNVGSWCDHCRGKAECPAVKNAIMTMQNAVPLKGMDDTDIIALYDKVTSVKAFCDQITEEVKVRCRMNGSCGEYTVKTISGATDIVDNNEMLTRMAKWLTPDEVALTAKYSLTALADALYAKRKASGEKVTKVSAKADVMQTLEGCLSKRPDTERIVKK